MAPTGDGEVSATSCNEPPRIHSATTRPPAGVHDVKHSGDTGLVDPAEPQRTGQGLLEDVVGQDALRVDEGQRHLAVQRCVKRLPELQGWYTPVEDQQAVAAVSDAGAGNQLHIIWGADDSRSGSRSASNAIGPRPHRRADRRFAGRMGAAGKRGRGHGRLARRAEARRRRAAAARHPTRHQTRRSPMGGRSPPVLSLSRLWLPAPEACAGSARGPHFSPRRGQTPPLRVRDRSGARRLIQDILGLRPGLQAPAPDSGSHGIQRRPRLGHPCAEGDRSQNWQHDESQHRQPQQRTDAARVGRQLA